jgi:hypothetical protein
MGSRPPPSSESAAHATHGTAARPAFGGGLAPGPGSRSGTPPRAALSRPECRVCTWYRPTDARGRSAGNRAGGGRRVAMRGASPDPTLCDSARGRGGRGCVWKSGGVGHKVEMGRWRS